MALAATAWRQWQRGNGNGVGAAAQQQQWRRQQQLGSGSGSLTAGWRQGLHDNNINQKESEIGCYKVKRLRGQQRDGSGGGISLAAAAAPWWQRSVRGRTTISSIKNTQGWGITESKACKGSSTTAMVAVAAWQQQWQLGRSTMSGAAQQ